MPADSPFDSGATSAHADAWLRFIIERMPAVVWSTDVELRFTSGHGAALAPLGVRPNSLNGVSLYDYFQTRDDNFPVLRAHHEALAGRRQTLEQTWAGRTYASVVEPLRDRRGQIIGCVGMAFDISDRKQSEDALRLQYTQLQELLEHVPAMLYQTRGTVDGSELEVPYLSARARDYFGLEPEAVYREPMLVLEAIHPEDRPGYYEKALAALRARTQFEHEFRVVTPTGEVRWIRAISRHTAGGDGLLTWHGVVVDISARRQREADLRLANDQMGAFVHNRVRDVSQFKDQLQREISDRLEVEQRLRKQTGLMSTVLSHMPVIAFRISPHLQLEEVQGAGVERFDSLGGYDRVYNEVVQRPEILHSIRVALAGGNSHFVSHSAPGEADWALETYLTHDTESPGGAIGFALDVTEREKALRELKRSEERWHALTDTSGDSVLMVNPEGFITYINRPVAGVDSQQVIGSHLTSWVPDDRKTELRERLARVLLTGEAEAYEMNGYAPGGANAWYMTRIGPFRQAGKVVGAVLYVTDITQRKQVEQAQLATEQRYRLLMEAAHDAIVIIDAQTEQIVDANTMTLELTGLSSGELAALRHTELYAEASRERVTTRFREFAAQQHGLIDDVELLGLHGAPRPVEVSLKWTEIDGRQLVVAIVRDVTERKRAEQTLRGEEKLLRELLNLHERERRLIAYEIHDGFVQDVVGAHLALEGAAAQLEDGRAIAADELARVRGLLRHAIDEGRRMISELRPMIIDERGIIDAISYLISEHALQGSPEIIFTHDVEFQRLSPLLEGTMFRIVQEALTNIQRHSQAGSAEIELVQHDGRVKMTIRDQGVGFDMARVPADRFGLRGMKERARLFGGRTTIRSAPGEGTEIAVDLPIEPYLNDGDSP